MPGTWPRPASRQRVYEHKRALEQEARELEARTRAVCIEAHLIEAITHPSSPANAEDMTRPLASSCPCCPCSCHGRPAAINHINGSTKGRATAARCAGEPHPATSRRVCCI